MDWSEAVEWVQREARWAEMEGRGEWTRREDVEEQPSREGGEGIQWRQWEGIAPLKRWPRTAAESWMWRRTEGCWNERQGRTSGMSETGARVCVE